MVKISSMTPRSKDDQGDKGGTLGGPIRMTRDEVINWVHRTLKCSRDLALPGSFNQSIISQLFWEQSTPWNEPALSHIEIVGSWLLSAGLALRLC